MSVAATSVGAALARRFADCGVAAVVYTDIARDGALLGVDAKDRGGIGETGSPFTVTIAVNARQSQLVAAAIADGDISIARTTGAASSKETPPQALERIGTSTDG